RDRRRSAASDRGSMPATTQDTLRMTLEAAAEAIRTRRVSPVSLVESCLARIEAVEPRLNAFITVTAELALEQARQAEREIETGRSEEHTSELQSRFDLV